MGRSHAVLPGAAGFVGLAFSKSQVELLGVDPAPGGGLLPQAGSELTLSLTRAPATSALSVSPIGRDAEQLTVTLPATVTIVFEAAGAAFTAVAPSSAIVSAPALP